MKSEKARKAMERTDRRILRNKIDGLRSRAAGLEQHAVELRDRADRLEGRLNGKPDGNG